MSVKTARGSDGCARQSAARNSASSRAPKPVGPLMKGQLAIPVPRVRGADVEGRSGLVGRAMVSVLRALRKGE
jgi:hypothetical protein